MFECKFCGKSCKNLNSKAQHEIRCSENPNRKVVDTSKFTTRGRTAWNKGLTKETSPQIQKQVISYRSNRDQGLHKDTTGANNSMSKPGARANLSKAMKKVYSINPPKAAGRGKHGKYQGIQCDSTWELAFLVYAIDHGYNIQRNTKRFGYMWDGSEHSYFPDFYMPDSDTYIEIKGHEDEKAREKHRQFKDNLIVLKKDDLKDVFAYISKTYGNNIEYLYDK